MLQAQLQYDLCERQEQRGQQNGEGEGGEGSSKPNLMTEV